MPPPFSEAGPARGAPGKDGLAAVYQLLAAADFQSPWYWVLHVVVWAVACARTMGVPYDMVVRARRIPEVAARVDLLAALAAARIAGAADAAGPALAATTGFVLAGIGGLGFWTGIEAAQAVFFLLAPLAAVGCSQVSLAFRIRGGLAGPALVAALDWRRVFHQAIAFFGMGAAVAVASVLHPPAL